tara:strand:+ start:465 stop:770 length:306 start_codon:yes stop_codon:yes gene_type:complete
VNKIFIISLILFLILFTTIIKNSTKKIEEGIFSLEENIRVLKNEFNNVQLEFEYLSSSQKLLEFQNLYFDDELVKKSIDEINIINKSNDESLIEEFKIVSE